MTILANATLTKLREYSQSYGSPEKINIAFIKEFEKEIQLISDQGLVIRTMKKGTKVLINFAGAEISEKAFTTRINKSKKAFEARCTESIELAKIQKEKINAISVNQIELWTKFLSENPSKVEKYKSKISTMPSSKWRNLLRLKAAKHVNNGSFEGLEISAPELIQVLNNL